MINFLGDRDSSLVVTTKHLGHLLVVNGDGVKWVQWPNNAFGVVARDDVLALAGTDEVQVLANHPDAVEPGTDARYVLSTTYHTGNLLAHELEFVGDRLLLAAARLNAVVEMDPVLSCRVVWTPPFLDSLVVENRFNINGIACDDSGLRYVTAFSTENYERSFKDDITSGVLIDAVSNEVLVRNLIAPHSPTLLPGGQVLFCDSGRGEVCVADPADTEYSVVATLPGFTRGVALFERHAIVATSQIRGTAVEGASIPLHPDHCVTALWSVDLLTGDTAMLTALQDVREVYQIAALPHSNPWINVYDPTLYLLGG